jgi:hypothetical protein
MRPRERESHARSAYALLERMRRTPAGWSARDFERLYTGFGFVKRERGGHTVYYHSVHREVRVTVARSRSLKSWVARDAVSVVEMLLKLEEERRE